jgi:hypothetical protein
MWSHRVVVDQPESCGGANLVDGSKEIGVQQFISILPLSDSTLPFCVGLPGCVK